MKTDYENRITLLLDRFFDGGTTPAEESELERLIAEANALPKGCENDCRAFTLCRETAAPEVPDGLKERLEAAIDNRAAEELAAKAKERLAPRRKTWGAIAAAAAIAVAIMIPALRQGDTPLPSSDEPTLALVQAPPALPDTSVAVSPTEVEEQPSEAPERPSTPTAAKPRAPRKQAPAATTTRVIDDPDEAAVYLAKAFSKIEKAKRSTHRGMAECDRLLERAGQALGKAADIVGTAADPAANPA
ncbi:MAG: hypothetical protein NC210_07655 [[Clostridium] fimetarium]|nr:hypothetical protein [Alistipes timonensis]MCM1406281.1 hypothetical protein [[Clostridium] fimetarium]